MNSGKKYIFHFLIRRTRILFLKFRRRKHFIDHLGGGGSSQPLCNSGQSDQLPSLRHQGDEQECR